MCEYCGCQALQSISVLTAEHDTAVELIGRVGSAVTFGDLESAAGWAAQLAALLRPHTLVEEQGLFPALAQEFPDHVTRLVDQHRQIEAVLLEPGPPPYRSVPHDWGQRLITALESLRDHILAEQDGVFPAALATLDVDQWAAVDEVRRRVGSRLTLATTAAPRPG